MKVEEIQSLVNQGTFVAIGEVRYCKGIKQERSKKSGSDYMKAEFKVEFTEGNQVEITEFEFEALNFNDFQKRMEAMRKGTDVIVTMAPGMREDFRTGEIRKSFNFSLHPLQNGATSAAPTPNRKAA